MNYTIMVLAAYAVIMIAATVLMTNKEKSVERFCVGNRNIGWFISALSIAATWIWAPALFTSTENAYTKGFAGLFWFLVPNVLCLIFFIPFASNGRYGILSSDLWIDTGLHCGECLQILMDGKWV